ncbi:MAG TPA: hypothetical protein VI318_04045 [Baekduia sp.]
MGASRPEITLSTRRALKLAFDDLRSHGVDARAAFAGTREQAEEEILAYLSAEFPDAIGSWAVWLESDSRVFNEAGLLSRPLEVYCSGAEAADITLLMFERRGVRTELLATNERYSVIVYGKEPTPECLGQRR